jgi:hypothetical protein
MLAKGLVAAMSKRKVQLLKQVTSTCLFLLVFLRIVSCTGEGQLGALELLNYDMEGS